MALASGWFAGRIRAHCLLPLVHLAKPRPACFCGGAQEAVDDRCAPAGNRLPHCGLSVDRRGLASSAPSPGRLLEARCADAVDQPDALGAVNTWKTYPSCHARGPFTETPN